MEYLIALIIILVLLIGINITWIILGKMMFKKGK